MANGDAQTGQDRVRWISGNTHGIKRRTHSEGFEPRSNIRQRSATQNGLTAYVVDGPVLHA